MIELGAARSRHVGFRLSIPLVCILFTTSSRVSAPAATDQTLALDRVSVVAPAAQTKAEKSAVSLLVEEIERRTGVRPDVSSIWPAARRPVIALGLAARSREWAGRHAPSISAGRLATAPEGYTIRTVSGEGENDPVVLVAGNDPRGVLFGCGRLLRELHMSPGRVAIPAGFTLTDAPRTKIRGHQMGYRPKTNSYDAWSEEIWRQYIRDLAAFGTNAVEMIPPKSDDDPDSPHFPLPQIEMMARVSRILDAHDMDVWIWYPAMAADYSKPGTVQSELKEWGEVFARMPRLDAIFVPGGDPGHTHPAKLLSFLERVTAELHRHHPRAQMWMSPQSFNKEWMDEFLRIMRETRPRWLSGLVYGPQTRMSLPELRAAIPALYPIRRYPDITHSLSCQYPVPDWDVAFALTEARECINPRPVDEAIAFRAFKDHAAGFITYSEGCNDDVNKFIWSGLGWNPDEDVTAILRQYSRYFIGPQHEQEFAEGLVSLERNWRGPLRRNEKVGEVLRLFQKMEREGSPRLLLNWRFQQAMYRACYDAYVRERLLTETDAESRAMAKLRQAATFGSLAAMEQAETILAATALTGPAAELRLRIHQLAEALYQSIRMQLSVKLYRAIAVGRGANLDTLDEPLNNRLWLRNRFAEIRKLPGEQERQREISAIVNWEDPGPGGFYDEPGNPENRPHLVPGRPYSEDPAFFHSPITAFLGRPGWKIQWMRHGDALFDNELKLRYEGLKADAQYRVRIVYSGTLTNPVRLVADDRFEIHPLAPKPAPIRPVEYSIPVEATRDGTLTLSWTSTPGRGGNGRGPQVSEVWLLKY